MSGWPCVIVHADMDAFYAAVEQFDDPSLRGKPVLVGPRSARGVVLTASYEARPFGVGSAMPMVEALRRCPQALVVPPRFERYQAVSRIVMDVFADFSPAVEALSLDEAFLDMSGAERIFGPPAELGRRLKDAVREATGGLTVSVGISATKFVAKVASARMKPDGLTIVPPQDARSWLAPLSVSWLWGAGAKTAERLRGIGLETIGDVAAADPAMLRRELGSIGERLHALARAEDPRAVEASRAAKSIGSELTLSADTQSAHELELHLHRSADKVARRLRRAGLCARGVRVKLKRYDFKLMSKQRALAEPTDVAEDLYRAARALLRSFGPLPPVRLVGLAAFELVPRPEGATQGDLLSPRSRMRDLEVALDRLAERFGPGVVTRASELVRDRGVGEGTNLDFLRDPKKSR
ncbi:MAG TPA: DNA polymerase IV [Gammaproteobacteria bacterium]